jgi:hypothetical protein
MMSKVETHLILRSTHPPIIRTEFAFFPAPSQVWAEENMKFMCKRFTNHRQRVARRHKDSKVSEQLQKNS